MGAIIDSNNELSILIPVYNQVCTDKVKRLKSLCDGANLHNYEIIVADDASTDTGKRKVNEVINQWEHCTFVIRKENKGSGATRNYLAAISQYRWLLFLDCDMDIPDDRFIDRYVALMGENAVINGGIGIGRYENEKEKNLRFIYELNAEKDHTAEKRNQSPYKEFRSTNFMIPHDIFANCMFEERMKRYEDVLFGKVLRQKGFNIIHIDNPVIMNDFENNHDYIDKVELDLRTIIKFRSELQGYSSMLRFTDKLRQYRLTAAVRLWHRLMGKAERRHLIGKHPTLTGFNLYRLGYFVVNNK